MYFELLQSRLISRLRSRVRNGEVSERRIAHLTGVSQPHIHNVLKGVRVLSPEIADLIVLNLNISLTELLDPEGIAPANEAPYSPVPILEGRIGPAFGYPERLSTEWHGAPAEHLTHLMRPVFGRLAKDAAMYPVVREDYLGLLDQSEASRTFLETDALYAVIRARESALRYVRRGMDCLYLLTLENRQSQQHWEWVSLAGESPLWVIRGRVMWISPDQGTAESDPRA